MHDFDSTSPEYDNIDDLLAEMQAHPSLLLTAETMLDRLRWLSRDWYSDIQILPGRVYLRADSEQLTPLNDGEHLCEDEIFRLVMLVTRGTKHHADVQRLWTESRKPSEDRTWIALDPFDVSFALDDAGRFRARVFLSYSRNPEDLGLSVSIRRVLPRLFSLDELAEMGMSGPTERFCRELVGGETHSGLVLICGPTGSGKSTTLNSILDEMNTRLRESRNCVTIEDPIEWVHRDDRMRCIQMEVGRHVDSIQTALTGMLRQDPDIIVIGEIRSREAAVAALDAAETGHLVFATLHAANAVRGLLKLLHWTDKDHAKLAGAVVAVIAQQRLLVEEPKKGQSLTSIRGLTSGEFTFEELTGETTPEVADDPDDRRFRALFTEILLPGKNPEIVKLLAEKSDDPAAYRAAHGLAGEDTFEAQFAAAVRKGTMTEAWALDHSTDKAAFRAFYVKPDSGK